MPDHGSLTGPGDLQIRGGTGGVVARLEDLEQAGDRLRSVAEALGRHGRRVLELAADPGLHRTAPLSPVTFARAEVALAGAGLGPGGLLAVAARLELLGAGARAVATAGRTAEATAATAFREATSAAGPAVETLVAGLSFGTAGAAGPIGTAATMVMIEILDADSPDRGGPEPNHDASPVAALRRIGGLTLRLLADHAVTTEAVLPILPGLLTGFTRAVPTSSLLAAAVIGDPSGPDTMADVAAGVGALGSVVGALGPGPSWFQDSGQNQNQVRVEVRPESRPDAHPPVGASDLLARIPGADLNRAAGPVRPSQIHVERLDGVEGRAWVVAIPGTVAWSPVAGRTPFDLTGAVRLMAGERTAGTAGVVAALRATGVRPGEPVMLVGHSQGGLIAAALAADPEVRREFAVRQVLTSGAPIASMPMPDDVQVLSIEHSDDLVPRLDGSANRDRPNWITVTAAAPTTTVPTGERAEPLLAHRVELYRQTAARIDRSTDPTLSDWRTGLAPFLARPGRSVLGWDVEISRVGRS